MEILAHRLDQVTQFFERNHGKGEYHAAALYREIFKAGNLTPFCAEEFKASRALALELEDRLCINPGEVVETIEDGRLTKFITRLSDGLKIESVIIPMTRHRTLCVSSQVGCRMGCRFCRTAKIGLKRNLSVSEITGQVFNARFNLGFDIKNIVFMGMGEPFDNFENVIQSIRIMNEQKGFDIALRHMTLSTAGLTRGIRQLAGMKMPGIRLAVSINSARDDIRTRLMPVNRTHDLSSLKNALQAYPLKKRGCFLFEYILIKGLNDSQKDAINLAEYIKPLPVRLNLIPYNPVCGFNYQSPDDRDMHRFSDMLTQNGIFVIKRWSKGRSVAAGCGQLGRSESVEPVIPSA